MVKIINFFSIRKIELIVLLLTIVISFLSFYVFAFSQQKHLADYDAVARLNIARKVTDSLTPGLGQLGGIWLPLPQLFIAPLTMNEYLWRTGFAGSIVSMFAFIFSAFFIFKLIYLLTENKIASLLGWLVFVSNINVLYLQTSALSESFFLFSFILAIYFTLKWVKEKNLVFLLGSAFSITLITLTRYEGYAVFLGILISIFIVSFIYYRKLNKKIIEGTLVIFLTLASLGIFLWTIYSATIFGDPFYWMNLYSGSKTQTQEQIILEENEELQLSKPKESRSLNESFVDYGWSIFLMNGMIITLLAILGFIKVLIDFVYKATKKDRSILLLVPILVLSIFLFTFLIIGYQRGFIPPIEAPPYNSNIFFDRSVNFAFGSNIRYGIVLFPLIVIFVSLIAMKNKLGQVFVLTLIIIQIITIYTTDLFTIYQIPAKQKYIVSNDVKWFNENYDEGKVLISARRNEYFVFQSEIDYKNYIYEGSYKYWKESLLNPTKYATWIVINRAPKNGSAPDSLDLSFRDNTTLYENYNLVYNNRNFEIFKKK